LRRGIRYESTEAIKKLWHERFSDPRPLTAGEEGEASDYCLADTRACLALALDYEPDMQWPRALHYGQYSGSLAGIVHTGIPVDVQALSRLQRHAGAARRALIEEGDRDYGCYENGHLRNHLVWQFARRHGIPWPALASGAPVLADEELKTLAARYPVVEGFRQLKKTVSALRSNKYAAGPDGRSHVDLHAFATITGRNAPKGSQSIFLAPAWMRGFMRAPPGHALAYLDFEAEEFAIRAAASGDEAMIEAYLSGDPYMATAVLMGLAPAGATKHSHPILRTLCKVLALAIGYGMSQWGLAHRLGCGEAEACELLQRFDRAFPKALAWSEGGVAYAKANHRITTPFGWTMQVARHTRPRTLLNWPMQSLGADLLRCVTIALVAARFRVVSLIHDAVLVETPIRGLRETVEAAAALMSRVSEKVVGIPLRVDLGNERNPHIFPYPARFRDAREGDMYDRMMRLLRWIDAEAENLSHTVTGFSPLPVASCQLASDISRHPPL
jgi:DNA polymerase I-like protein with 3'-5' exonuclease and polymerase domains